MGMKITKLKPVGGFCAETAGAATIFAVTHFGIPVSTTHTITGAIVGVGLDVGVRVLSRGKHGTRARRQALERALAERNFAELARRLGVSRARITQWLDLLELPEEILRQAEALGDQWDRQVVTERELRRSL
jgi:phosphate/sulfate permease